MTAGPRPYLHWLNFVETLLTLAFQIVTISLMSRVMFYGVVLKDKFKCHNMSKTVVSYMTVHIAGSILAIPHHLYLVILWKPVKPGDEPLYDPNVLYWTGIFDATYLFAPSLPVFLLTVDRCIALKFPVKYNSRFARRTMPTVTTVLTISWCCAIAFGFLLELPLDIGKMKHCEASACVFLKYHAMPQICMKVLMAIMNVLCTAYFLYALYAFKSCDGTRKLFTIKNCIVIVTAGSEIILNVLPLMFNTIFLNVTGETSAYIFGNYGLMLSTLDAMICAIFYERIYLKRNIHNNNAKQCHTQVIKIPKWTSNSNNIDNKMFPVSVTVDILGFLDRKELESVNQSNSLHHKIVTRYFSKTPLQRYDLISVWRDFDSKYSSGSIVKLQKKMRYRDGIASSPEPERYFVDSYLHNCENFFKLPFIRFEALFLICNYAQEYLSWANLFRRFPHAFHTTKSLTLHFHRDPSQEYLAQLLNWLPLPSIERIEIKFNEKRPPLLSRHVFNSKIFATARSVSINYHKKTGFPLNPSDIVDWLHSPHLSKEPRSLRLSGSFSSRCLSMLLKGLKMVCFYITFLEESINRIVNTGNISHSESTENVYT
ncbi:hypothetical protein DdX_19529 [Ditylenchus destructor]|uniref:Uncharacterized protein n=1 Tax=Ditylenchus destructor TaxID=166010 RepID=A0AAD4QXB9_9BILA|nr:hypothetical protein DdX_19529 [Ditylenchus destructor]